MSIPREDSDGAVPSAAAPEPPSGVSPEEMESREDLTIEAKEVREAIRFGHADAKERFREFDERCETAGWGRPIADRLFWLLYRGELTQESSSRLKIARLKDRTVPAVRAKLAAVQAIAVGMPTVAERLAVLEDALVAWKKRVDAGATDLETAESDAVELKKSADLLEDEARNTPILADIVRKSRGLMDTAHTDDNAPAFIKDEMKTVRRVLEILARQTDWTKAEKAVLVFQRCEERKRRLERLVGAYSRLGERLVRIGQLEDEVAAEREQLFWQNPESFAASVLPAAHVRSSRQLEIVLEELSGREQRLKESVACAKQTYQLQSDIFRKETTKCLCTEEPHHSRVMRNLGITDEQTVTMTVVRKTGKWRIVANCIGGRQYSLSLDPQPSVLFKRTLSGSFEDRCRLIVQWYELLFELCGPRQAKSLKIGDMKIPAPAFLHLCELAGSCAVDEPDVLRLVQLSRTWDALFEEVSQIRPENEGQDDSVHLRMFQQAEFSVQKLVSLCDTCSVDSDCVQAELRRLREASEWVSHNRKFRAKALYMKKAVSLDVQTLRSLGRKIGLSTYLRDGETLILKSDFNQAIASFEHARAELNTIFRTWAFRLVSKTATCFKVKLPRTNNCLEFNCSENGLWFGCGAVTIDQYRAVFPSPGMACGVQTDGSGACVNITIDEAKEYARMITTLAERTNFRLPHGSWASFRVVPYKMWEKGLQSGAFRRDRYLFGELCETRDIQHAWFFYYDRDVFSSSQRRLQVDIGSRSKGIGFRLICEPQS